jgi:hypothetical protein
MSVRKNNHIQVDYFYRLMPKAMGRVISTAVDVLRCLFLGYSSWLCWLLIQRIGSSRMAIVDLPVGWVFGAVLFGFVLMFWRSLEVAWRPLEAGLQRARAARGGRRGAMTGGGMMGAFVALMVSGLPVAMAMAGAALIYVMVSGNIPDFVIIHRMYGGVDSFPLLAVPFFIWAGKPDELGRDHEPHLQLRARAGRLAQGRARARQRRRLDDLRRHVGHRDRRRRGPRHDRDQGDDGPWATRRSSRSA